MGQDDQEKAKRGFLYYWANKEKPPTIKRVPCEVYSRIVGYMRPVKQWNKGKKQEFADRQVYDLPEVGFFEGQIDEVQIHDVPIIRSELTYDDAPVGEAERC